MNLILLDRPDKKQHLPVNDRRTEHIRKTLFKSKQGKLYVGIPNGAMGMAEVAILTDGSVQLDIEWEEPTTPLQAYPLVLMVGLSRPQTCRKILREVASLGVRELVFFQSDKGEPAYASSSLWHTDEWKRQLHEGVEQSFTTCVPEVQHYGGLAEAIERYSDSRYHRIALDNYEATMALSAVAQSANAKAVLLAIGSERGFSSSERTLLRDTGFTLAHLGSRVLRTETAVIAGCSVLASICGWYI